MRKSKNNINNNGQSINIFIHPNNQNMKNYYFKELIRDNDKAEFIGYGNPDADILIIGKECAIDPEHDKDNIYELSITKNREQWLSIINETNKQNPDNIPSWFSECPREEKFSPLFPFKGQLFTQRKRNENHGTNTTWYNYQKLIDRIRAIDSNHPDRTKNDEIDFLKDCFITEFSGICSLYSKKSPEVTESIKNRTTNLLNHPFFKSFPIIIIACGHYVRQYKDIIDLQKLFEVKWDERTIEVENNWYNLHKGNNKTLIHTNQLSMNISNQLLDEIAKECQPLFKGIKQEDIHVK